MSLIQTTFDASDEIQDNRTRFRILAHCGRHNYLAPGKFYWRRNNKNTMKYKITIPYEETRQTVEDDTQRLRKLGAKKIRCVCLDAWKIECIPEVLTIILLSIQGSRVVSTLRQDPGIDPGQFK